MRQPTTEMKKIKCSVGIPGKIQILHFLKLNIQFRRKKRRTNLYLFHVACGLVFSISFNYQSVATTKPFLL